MLLRPQRLFQRQCVTTDIRHHYSSPDAVDQSLNRPTMPDDSLAALGEKALVLSIVDEKLIDGEKNRVKLMSMGTSPHAYEMLGVWVVDKNYFFVSDVHVPRSDEDVPSEQRAVTECWFAKWAVTNLPPDVRVVNSHSDQVTPVSRLAKYLESDLCR